jgi:hypothetical protein
MVIVAPPEALKIARKWGKANLTKIQRVALVEEPPNIIGLNKLDKIAKVRNIMLESALKTDSEYIWFVDSDIVEFQNDILQYLLAANRDIVAPLVLLEKTRTWFYDCWSFRKGIHSFFIPPPYFPGMDITGPPVELNSVGCCYLVKTKAARVSEFGISEEGSEHVTFCKGLKDAGYGIFVDPSISVHHAIKPLYHNIAYWRNGDANTEPKADTALKEETV